MRDEIQANGETIVGCHEIQILCADNVSANGQWNTIAKIAVNEHWSFTFFPNGSVRFAKL